MMRTAARAIAWEFRARHRWGLIALAGYFLVLATIKLLILRGERVHFDGVGDFALVVIVPITATFLYALVVFTFGFDGHVAARQSMYPARKFTLPVTTAALAVAAALVAWAQAFMWMPYPLPGLRVAATVLWLVTFDTIVLLALEFKAPEPVMLAILAPQVPLAYLAARFAVARAGTGRAA